MPVVQKIAFSSNLIKMALEKKVDSIWLSCKKSSRFRINVFYHELQDKLVKENFSNLNEEELLGSFLFSTESKNSIFRQVQICLSVIMVVKHSRWVDVDFYT